MKTRALFLLIALAFSGLVLFSPSAFATSTYAYKPGEYVTVANGRSPNGQYAISAHGGGDLGDENFHIYLMDARSGRKIGPLEEIKDTLDTGADAYQAHWSADSRQVSIGYRIDRHNTVTVRYRIENGRASLISGPK